MGKKWPHTRTSIFERLNMKSSSDLHKRHEENVARQNMTTPGEWGCAAVMFLFAVGTVVGVCYTAYRIAALFAPHNS